MRRVKPELNAGMPVPLLQPALHPFAFNAVEVPKIPRQQVDAELRLAVAKLVQEGEKPNFALSLRVLAPQQLHVCIELPSGNSEVPTRLLRCVKERAVIVA